MSYTQPVERPLLGREQLDRRVLIAVELFDPVAQSLVTANVIIKANGLAGDPIRSWSGRFVWLVEGGAWPSSISVTPVGLPFSPRDVTPSVPLNFPNPTAADRLVRIVLQPTAAYDFTDVTAVRGLLRETSSLQSAPVENARAQLAWFDSNSGTFRPAPPAQPQDPTTDKKGQFAAFVRAQKTVLQEPDLVNGFVKVRVQITRQGSITETRATPDNFPFVSDPLLAGRTPEGQLLTTDLRLGWADLLPI